MMSLALGLFIACSNDEDSDDVLFVKNKGIVVSEETSGQLKSIYDSRIICFSGSHYFLTCGAKEAEEFDISDSVYTILQQEIIKANKMIDEIIDQLYTQGYNNVKIVDCTYGKEEPNLNKLERLVPPDAPQMPHGVLTAIDNSPVSTGFHAPYNQVGVKAHCYANTAPLAFHGIITTYAGGSAMTATRMGSGYLTVGIAMSNTTIGLKYQTTDSNGGTCAWQGVTSI